MKDFEYVNPHAWLYVVVTNDNGEETLWGFEAEGPSALMRAGIRNNALQPGDLVTANHWEYEYYFRKLGPLFSPDIASIRAQAAATRALSSPSNCDGCTSAWRRFQA